MRSQMVDVPGLLDDRPVVFDAVEIEQHYETVRTDLPEPDPAWRFVDDEGHGHFMADDPKDRYPTLVWTITRTYYCPDCRVVHDEREYRCRVCSETVTPGTRAPRGPLRVPTYVTFSATMSEVGMPQPSRDREYVVKVGRDSYTTRISGVALSSRGASFVLEGGPLRQPTTSGS